MYKYTLFNGAIYRTKLDKKKFAERYNDLCILVTHLEGYESGTGYELHKRAYEALSKMDNFTGIIRLNQSEKDFLSYNYYESEYTPDWEKKVIAKYI